MLYEMLTGQRAFTGETTPDVLEAVVKSDPDWSKLPPGTPRLLRRLLERTLTKDRKQRLQAIGEARIVLSGTMEDPGLLAQEPARPRGQVQISNGDGIFPIWSRNTPELYYEGIGGNGIMIASYTVQGGTFVAEKPRVWSNHKLFIRNTKHYDLAPDGKRFVILEEPGGAEQKPETHVNLLLNFGEELRRRVPIGK